MKMVVVVAFTSIQVPLGLLEPRISQCKATRRSVYITSFYEIMTTTFKLT